MVFLLRSKGADPHLTDNEGKSVSDVADANGRLYLTRFPQDAAPASSNLVASRPESSLDDLGVEGGVAAGVVGGVPEVPPAAVRVGGNIKEPKKLKEVQPTYPASARQARVQGAVILECTISPQGRVTDVRVVRGIPLLDQSAIEAVKQRVYSPTLLNGVAVPVIMTVTVGFTLD